MIAFLEGTLVSGGTEAIVSVGGGVGLAPLRSLILALMEDSGPVNRLSIRYGARCVEELRFGGQRASAGVLAADKLA